MTVLWDTDPSSRDRYNFALGEGTRVVESAALVSRALQDGTEVLVVIGPDIDLQAVCDLADQLRVDRPEVGVVMLRRRLEVTLLAQALRSGVREVVAADDLTGLADAVRRSRDLSVKFAGHSTELGSTEGRVVTVFSAKGGVGKTTFSTNIAAYLASDGARVLLIDLDLAFGDVGISLQMLPQNSIVDLIGMAGHIDEQAIQSVVTTHESGLDALCAPAEPSDADRIPGQVVAEILRVARRTYDYVVVDTPPAFTEHVLAAFDSSDALVLIATLDIPAVKNLRLTLDTLDLLGSPREARIVVLNRSDTKVGLKAEDVVTAIRQDIAIMVPNSTAVPASVNRGVPIVLDEPRHPVSVSLKRLIDEYMREPVNGHNEGVSVGAQSRSDGAKVRRTDGWSLLRGARR